MLYLNEATAKNVLLAFPQKVVSIRINSSGTWVHFSGVDFRNILGSIEI